VLATRATGAETGAPGFSVKPGQLDDLLEALTGLSVDALQ
jgi:hypothetical protein